MKIRVNGKEVEATPVAFVAIQPEPFVEYHLEGGDVVRVKFVVTRILATGERNEQGEPIYSFNFQPVAIVDEKAKEQPN